MAAILFSRFFTFPSVKSKLSYGSSSGILTVTRYSGGFGQPLNLTYTARIQRRHGAGGEREMQQNAATPSSYSGETDAKAIARVKGARTHRAAAASARARTPR
jgi:hypothetical protein